MSAEDLTKEDYKQFLCETKTGFGKLGRSMRNIPEQSLFTVTYNTTEHTARSRESNKRKQQASKALQFSRYYKTCFVIHN